MVTRPIHPRARRAFALIDIIVAAILLGIVVSALFALSARAIASLAEGSDIATAAALADERLHLVLARGADDYTSRFPVSGNCDEPFDRFQYELRFEDGSTGIPYRVSATIRWPSRQGLRSITVETLVAPRLGDEPDPIRTPELTVPRQP